jgi:RNA polymerase sigma-70 factor (ECF subfamily)
MRARGRSIDIIRTEVARRRREETQRYANDDYNQDSDVVMIGAESALVVRDALALLPANQREPIHLAFFSGLTYQEVALCLNLPEGTVKGRIRAGMSRLQGNDQLLLLRQADGADATTAPGESAKPSLT